MEVWKMFLPPTGDILNSYFIEHSTEACLLSTSIKWLPGWNWVLFTLHNYLNISFDFTHAHIHSPTPTFKYLSFQYFLIFLASKLHACSKYDIFIWLHPCTWNFVIILVDHTINIPFILRKLITIYKIRIPRQSHFGDNFGIISWRLTFFSMM